MSFLSSEEEDDSYNEDKVDELYDGGVDNFALDSHDNWVPKSV